MNPNINRWLKASLSKHFRAVCNANSIANYHAEWELFDIDNKSESVLLRVIGPIFVELSNDQYLISFEIDLLITVLPVATNLLRANDIAGILAANCADIVITDNNSNFLFCATLDQSVRIIDYTPAFDMKARRVSVMAIYENEAEV